jgi:hypothetical protein
MPIDRSAIDQQLEALGDGGRWWDQRELRDLPAVMHADERILAIARGKLARMRWLRRSWLIVVTDRRLLCLRSGNSGWRQLELAAPQITRVALRIGPFRGRVIVATPGHTYRLLAPRTDAYRLASALTSVATGARAAISGFAPTRVVRRVFDHVLALPAIALDPGARTPPPPAPDTSGLEQRLQVVEKELYDLREQVDFLEKLLRDRQLAPQARAELP